MGRPGPKPRPALVFDLGTLHGDPAIEAIFVTSQKLERLYAGEFAITPEDGLAYRVSGLSRATKFDLIHSVFLPYSVLGSIGQLLLAEKRFGRHGFPRSVPEQACVKAPALTPHY